MRRRAQQRHDRDLTQRVLVRNAAPVFEGNATKHMVLREHLDGHALVLAADSAHRDERPSFFCNFGGDLEAVLNAQAVLHSSFESSSNMVATISGTSGRININSIWHESQSYSLVQNNHQVDFHHPTKGKGFTYEIEECHACIREEKIQSSLWSHKDCLNLIQIVDEVRKQTGLTYPQDQHS